MGSLNKSTLVAISSLFIVISFMFMIVVPLPPVLIDFAVVTSLAVSITIFLRSTTIRDWDDIKTFPTILLLTAVFRIGLNITTTRVILQSGVPGDVITKAGELIVGSNVWIGFVIFIILIVVQFIIANGASRMSEVSARFKLDSLPGKQMSIDSDLNQQLITQEEAAEKRKKLDLEVDFHGSMDGAGKYIKGDVWAGIVMTVVNIVFGFIIGMTVHGMDMASAAYKYTILTIGDGIVSQLSSLLITLSSGILLTKVSNDEGTNVVSQIFGEITQNPIVLNVVGALFIMFAFFMPPLPFIIIGTLIIAYGYYTKRKNEKDAVIKEKQMLMEVQEDQVNNQKKVEVNVEVEPITLEVGFSLIRLVDPNKPGSNIRDKVLQVRKAIANELGIEIPNIKVRDNTRLFPNSRYNILVKNSVVASGVMKNGHLLALSTPVTMTEIAGEDTKDPIFNEDAKWITPDLAQEAENLNYEVLDPLTIMVTHLEEVVRLNAQEFLPRQKVQELLDVLKEKHPILIEEIKKNEIKLSLIQKVLQNLIAENISIQDLPSIVESILECVESGMGMDQQGFMTHPDNVTMYVRQRINRQICEMNKNDDECLYVLILDQKIESTPVELTTNGYFLRMDMLMQQQFIESLKQEIKEAKLSTGNEPILLTSNNQLRPALMRLIRQYDIRIPVLSMMELHPNFDVQQVGAVKL